MKHLTAPPDLSKLPAEYVPIVGKALAKNPAQRYATIAEMAKAIEALAGGTVQPQTAPSRPAVPQPSSPPQPAAHVDELPTVLPAVSVRGQFAELFGSMALAAVLAALLSMLYTALAQVQSWSETGSVLFLTVAICWAIQVPAKFWNNRTGDSWMRRVVMMILGTAIGAGALWLNGLAQLPDMSQGLPARPSDFFDRWNTINNDGPPSVANMAGFISYFALSLCALRWWRLADRNRNHRFSCFPVIAAAFWAMVLMFIWPKGEAPYGAIALVTSAVIVQWVSPWDQPQPRSARRLRLRYA